MSECIKVVFLSANSQNIKSWIALNSKDEAVGHIFMSIEPFVLDLNLK